MRGSTYSEKIKMNIKKAVLEEDGSETQNMSEKCPERPSEDYLVNDSSLYYKSNNSNDLGLCFMTEDSNNSCNCNQTVSKENKVKCNNALWNQTNITDLTGNLCCSTRRINNPLPKKTPVDNLEYNNPSTKYYLAKTGSSGSIPLNIKLEDGVQNFNVINPSLTIPNGVTAVAEATVYKCPVTNMNDLEGRQVCLLDRNGNSNQKCPEGWKYNGKLDSQTYHNDINICCRNN
jgi:hypothetical protein